MSGVKSADIVSLVQPPRNENLVQMFTDLLEDAKTGRIQCGVVYVKYGDQNFNVLRAGRGSYAEDIGALEIMKQTMYAMSTGCEH